jgi:hypothetical protein
MKHFPLALLLLATTWSFSTVASGAAASGGTATDKLTEAARAAKAKRKKSTAKVLTNEDVKKSKGKLVETPQLPPLPDEGPQQTLSEKHAADKKSKVESDALLATARQNVATLEKQLATLEQKYYDENDLDRRDGELVKQFDDVAAKLQSARKELAALTPPEPDSAQLADRNKNP